MVKLRRGASLWLRQHRGATLRATTLHHNLDADIAIVGGGITGCAAAYRFAARGARVVLVDAARLGHGSTAASTALLMQEPDVDFLSLAERYGRPGARRIWEASRHAVRSLTTTLRRLDPGAGLHGLPSVYIARAPEHARDLQRELEARRRAGLAARWLSTGEIDRLTGIHAAGAILTPGNAQVDPYRACLTFAAAARDAGARLYAHTRVRRIAPAAGGVDVHTEHGRIRAAWAIVATGYATPEFKPLAGRFRMSHTYVLATPPLKPPLRRAIGLGDVMLWDTARPYHYARWTPDHRLLFGGCDRPRTRITSDATFERRLEGLRRDLVGLYPALETVPPAYAWEGLFATTPDGLPYIGAHRRYPRQLFALGYGGNGMTFGFMAGAMLERAARGESTATDALFGFGRGLSRRSRT